MGKIDKVICKKIISRVIYGYMCIPMFFLKVSGKKLLDIFMCEMCKIYEGLDSYYVSFNIRPRTVEQINVLNYKGPELPSLGIIIQGPLLKNDDFTLETIRFYFELFPNAKIIVSIWDDEDAQYLKRIIETGVIVVQSKKPANCGRMNLNMQLITTKAGIKRANELNVDFIMKTRSDQRIYRPNTYPFLLSLIDSFKCNNKSTKFNQKDRIIVLSMEYGNMFYPNLICDFFYFGRAEDITGLFSIKLDDSNLYMPSNSTNVSRREYSTGQLNPEIYIIKEYLKVLGISSDDSIKDYWEFVHDNLICISKKMIDLYWHKYESRFFEHQRNGSYSKYDSNDKLFSYNFDFENWLSLYSNRLTYCKDYEKNADVNFK